MLRAGKREHSKNRLNSFYPAVQPATPVQRARRHTRAPEFISTRPHPRRPHDQRPHQKRDEHAPNMIIRKTFPSPGAVSERAAPSENGIAFCDAADWAMPRRLLQGATAAAGTRTRPASRAGVGARRASVLSERKADGPGRRRADEDSEAILRACVRGGAEFQKFRLGAERGACATRSVWSPSVGWRRPHRSRAHLGAARGRRTVRWEGWGEKRRRGRKKAGTRALYD